MQMYAKRLKEYRKKHKYTQAETAEKLEMPQSNYSRLEKGEQDIRLSMIIHICSTLNLSVDWFLGICEEEDSNNFERLYVEVIDLICEYGEEDLIEDEIVTELTHKIDKIKRAIEA